MDGELAIGPRRQQLPNRRSSVTQTLHVAGREITGTVGFNRAGQPAELFLSSGRVGSEIDALLGDAAVAISVALQFGVPASRYPRRLERQPFGK